MRVKLLALFALAICLDWLAPLPKSDAVQSIAWLAIIGLAAAAAGSIMQKQGSSGSKPGVPHYPTAKEIMDEMIATNSGAIPELKSLAEKEDAANFDMSRNRLEGISPGIFDSFERTGENIGSRVRGEVPEDVQAALGRSNAARAFLSGTSGGADTSWRGGLEGRDIAKTSYGIQREGEADLEKFGGFLQQMFPTTDVRKMTFTAQDVERIMEQKWNEEWLRSKVNAAPPPGQNSTQKAGGILSGIGGLLGGAGGGAGGLAGLLGGGQPATLTYGDLTPQTRSITQPVSGSGIDYDYGAPAIQSPWGGGVWG